MSNKDAEGSESQGDPLEAVLYAVFVATSARASVAELGAILQVSLTTNDHVFKLATVGSHADNLACGAAKCSPTCAPLVWCLGGAGRYPPGLVRSRQISGDLMQV